MRSRLLFLICSAIFLSSCSSTGSLEPAEARLVFVQAGASGALLLAAQPDVFSEPEPLPFDLPADCSIYGLDPNPVGALLAVEFVCGGGPAVLVYDLDSGETLNPVASLQTDASFLAWSADGLSLYLKVDVYGNTRIVRYELLRARLATLEDLPAYVYDMAGLPGGRILYSLTTGIGYGSETWAADADGSNRRLLLSEPFDIIAYLRPSPDGGQVAFILLPDSQTPFPNGELWLMDVNGDNARSLAEADAGHGYAPAWSPDGTELAFVVRENPSDPVVEQSASALVSNIYRFQVQNGSLTPVTSLADAVLETPVWSPDGSGLFFNMVRNGTIQVWFAGSGSPRPLGEANSCCAVWVPGK